jgi:hypothetical protein
MGAFFIVASLLFELGGSAFKFLWPNHSFGGGAVLSFWWFCLNCFRRSRFLSPLLPYFEFGQSSSAFSFGEAALFEVGGFFLSTALLEPFSTGALFYCRLFPFAFDQSGSAFSLERAVCLEMGWIFSLGRFAFLKPFSTGAFFITAPLSKNTRVEPQKMLERSRNCGAGGGVI